MWSVIPVALLCMILNLCKREQANHPEGDNVLSNTGGLSFVQPSSIDQALKRARCGPLWDRCTKKMHRRMSRWKGKIRPYLPLWFPQMPPYLV